MMQGNLQMIKNWLTAPKYQLGRANAPMMVVGDLEINQLYEKIKNESKRTTEKTGGIMRNPKMEGLGKEVGNLCKQRRDARLAYIKDSKNKNTKGTYKSLNEAIEQKIQIFKKEKLEQKFRWNMFFTKIIPTTCLRLSQNSKEYQKIPSTQL